MIGHTLVDADLLASPHINKEAGRGHNEPA